MLFRVAARQRNVGKGPLTLFIAYVLSRHVCFSTHRYRRHLHDRCLAKSYLSPFVNASAPTIRSVFCCDIAVAFGIDKGEDVPSCIHGAAPNGQEGDHIALLGYN